MKTITAILTLMAFTAHLVIAQTQLGLELSQGVQFRQGVDPYTMSVRLQPAFSLTQKLFAGPAITTAYTNPDWALLIGGKIGYQIAAFEFFETPFLLLNAQVEALVENDAFLGQTNRVWTGAGLSINTDLPGIGLKTSHDWKSKSWILEVWIALNLSNFNKETDPDPFDS